MNNNEPQFESFLREFQPRDPGRLLMDAQSDVWRRLAAAAVILAGCTSLWLASHSAPEAMVPRAESARLLHPQDAVPPHRLSLLQLVQLAQDNPQKFHAVLDAASRQSLPGFQGKGSTLAVLAKE